MKAKTIKEKSPQMIQSGSDKCMEDGFYIGYKITAGKNKTCKPKLLTISPGIPEDIKNKIFQPFFTTKPTGSGTGLGLSLSYDIVKTHGGELKVERIKAEGSEFIIHLPII